MADSDDDIKYDRNKDKIYKSSAQCIQLLDALPTCRKYELMVIFVRNNPQKNCETERRQPQHKVV